MPGVPSDNEIIKFADTFCGDRIKTFKKDMDICMTPNKDKSHAYMPAIMGCAGFLELFSGLYAGNVEDPVSIRNILNFTNQFLDNTEYTEECICLFFAMFRHKVAHLSRPYSVFDSHNVRSNHHPLLSYPRRRFTWIITATFEKPAIKIISKSANIKKTRRPSWKQVSFTHICRIHLKRLIRSLQEAVAGTSGYLNCLYCSPEIRENFKNCMDAFFP